MADRYAEQAGMPWLPPKGLDTLKSIACNRGLWEDLGNGYVTKKPKKKRTSVQVIAESDPDDEGKVRLRVNPQNAGPAPRIYYAEDGPVSESSAQLKDQVLHHVGAARELPGHGPVRPIRDRRAGDLVQQARPAQQAVRERRQAHRRAVRRAHEARSATRWTAANLARARPTRSRSPSANGEVLLRAFAEADGLESKTEFRFPAKGKKGVQIDDVKPGRLVSRTGRKLDSRAKTFEGLKQAADKSATFEGIVLTVGQGNQMIGINVGEIAVDAAFIEALLAKVLEKFAPDTPITMTFRKAHFASGHDLKDFAGKLGIELAAGDVEQ